MRIKNDGVNLPTDRTGEVDGTRAQGPSGVRPSSPSKTDQVELSAEAQGKPIARSAGLEVQADDDTRTALDEYKHLQRSIGRTDLIALKPLSVTSDRDHWHTHLLGR